MTHWLRVLSALEEDLSSLPSIHSKWLTTICTSSTEGSDILFWSRWVPGNMVHMLLCRHTHKLIILKIKHFIK